MTSPYASAPTSAVAPGADATIAALLYPLKWGGAVGAPVAVSYSFPEWTNDGAPVFAGAWGAAYSPLLHEPQAAFVSGFDASQQAVATQALKAWADVANLTFTKVADTPDDVGDIRFAFTSAANRGAVAWACPPSAIPKAGDIWIGAAPGGAPSTAADWQAQTFGFETLVHEIGHALGLKHPFDGAPVLPAALDNLAFTLMAYAMPARSAWSVAAGDGFATTWILPDGPMVGDIAAIQYLYGANTAYRTGDDVYTFDPARPFFHAIWDAGGHDTVSLANYTLGCTLDLRPGHASNLMIAAAPGAAAGPASYDGTGALAIARGVTIEHGIGGQGDDVLYANDAGDELDGGPGNDTMFGGAGNDVFDGAAAGRSGVDTMTGGAGDDTYFVKHGDTVVESPGAGTDTMVLLDDTVFSLAGLPDVENLGVRAGTAADCVLTGNAADNVLHGGSGNNTFTGGAGRDTAVVDAPREAFTFAKTGGGTSAVGGGVTETFDGIELVRFRDAWVAFDACGDPGQAYRLYQAAFDRPPDESGLGYWIAALARGAALVDVAAAFLAAPEAGPAWSGLDDAGLVAQLYRTVLHRAGEREGVAFWTEHLGAQDLTRAGLLTAFSESPEHQAALVGAIEAGVTYTTG